MPRKVSRVAMMQDIWLRNEPPGDRPLFPAVGVLKPMKKAGGEIRDENRDDRFENNHVRIVPLLAARALIDKIASTIDAANMKPHQLELFYYVAKSKGVTRAA